MKSVWLIAVGAIAALTALFGANSFGFHIGAIPRICLLAVGLALLAFVMNDWAGPRIRAHWRANHSSYAAAARTVAFLLTGAVVLTAYVFFISLGTWKYWPSTTDYYGRLATALRSGHLYVKESPDPSLVALPNPYDPDARKGVPGLVAEAPGSIWDMSLYQGRVYLYWGPAPALLLLAAQAIAPVEFGDQQLTLAFLFGAFVFESLILLRLWRRFFAGIPAWTVIAGMLMLGFANPVPWLLFSPRIYEAAIAAGQFFLMGGLYFVLGGLDRPRVSHWRLAAGAAGWVCAVGSRATLAVAVVYLSLMVLAWLLWLQRGQWDLRRELPAAASFAAPLLVGAGLLAWYNYARFGSIFEFGFRYAITMLDQNKSHSVLFAATYLRPNAYLYLLNPPAVSGQFPFVKPVWNGDYVIAFNNRFHSIYNAERIIGLVYATPFLLLGLIPPVSALSDILRPRHDPATSAEADLHRDQGFLRWLLITLSGWAVLELLVVFLVFYSTMRYFMDTAPAWTILSMIGFWLVYRRLESHRVWEAGYALAAGMLVLFTIIIGILIGFSSDVPRLKAANPALLVHLRLFFIMLARRLGW